MNVLTILAIKFSIFIKPLPMFSLQTRATSYFSRDTYSTLAYDSLETSICLPTSRFIFIISFYSLDVYLYRDFFVVYVYLDTLSFETLSRD